MSDTKKEIICPACSKKMKKVQTQQGIYVDICTDGCGGIWFDNRELDKYKEKDKSIEDFEQYITGKNFEQVNQDVIRKCPVCGVKMVKNKISLDSETEIDECYTCGGKFLDYGELKKIREIKKISKEQLISVVQSLYEKQKECN